MPKYARVKSNPAPSALVRSNPVVDYKKDYEIPGYLRVRSHKNPQMDEFLPFYGRVVMPTASRRNPRARYNSGEAGITVASVGEYGRRADAEKIEGLLSRMFDNNMKRIGEGLSPIPICIWGSHGLGKTTLIRSLAKEKGWDVAYVAPAQFEEMGDLHGIPEKVYDDALDRWKTVYAPPDWAPKDTGRAGILIIDDFNRADDRILRGLMQLFQDGRLASWGLPSNWMIVATANPEGGDYGVTPIDDAMKTRMLHIELIWDKDVWLKWARKANPKTGKPNIDPRITDPVKGWFNEPAVNGMIGTPRYPRTTPRSLEQFFGQIRYIPNWKSSEGYDLVETYAYSALDKEVANSFLAWVRTMEEPTMFPGDILFAGTPLSSIGSTEEMVEEFFNSISSGQGDSRVDKRTKTIDGLIQFMLGRAEDVLRGEAYPDKYPAIAKLNPMGRLRARRNSGSPGFRIDSPGPLFAAAKNNLRALLLNRRFPQESVKTITYTMTTNSEVNEADGMDQYGGYIEKLAPKLILDIDVVKKAAGVL